MINMTLRSLSNPHFVSVALPKLMNTKGISVKAMWDIRGISKLIQEELSKFEEQRMSIIEEYAERNESGDKIIKKENGQTIIEISKDKVAELNSKMNQLLDITVPIPTIKLKQLENAEGLTANDLFLLDFIEG